MVFLFQEHSRNRYRDQKKIGYHSVSGFKVISFDFMDSIHFEEIQRTITHELSAYSQRAITHEFIGKQSGKKVVDIHESKGLGLAGPNVPSGSVPQIEHQFEGAVVVEHRVCFNVHREVALPLAVNEQGIGRGSE